MPACSGATFDIACRWSSCLLDVLSLGLGIELDIMQRSQCCVASIRNFQLFSHLDRIGNSCLVGRPLDLVKAPALVDWILIVLCPLVWCFSPIPLSGLWDPFSIPLFPLFFFSPPHCLAEDLVWVSSDGKCLALFIESPMVIRWGWERSGWGRGVPYFRFSGSNLSGQTSFRGSKSWETIGNLINRLVSRGEESRGKPNTYCLRNLGISLEEHKYFLLWPAWYFLITFYVSGAVLQYRINSL